MPARIPAIGLRLLVLVAVWLLASSTLSLANGGPAPGGQLPDPSPARAADAVGPPEPLLAPDVTGLPYVFAKGVLEDAGFAWRVEGGVEGYAVNVVAEQSVEPGTEVVDTGAPTILLHLRANPDQGESGLPDNASPYPGTELVPVAGQAADTALPGADAQDVGESSSRPPAFVLPGVAAEPLDQPPLPERARELADWLEAQPTVNPEMRAHYAHEHALIVTGATFGWWKGADALGILLRADSSLGERFGGAQELIDEARRALAYVERKAAGG